MSSGYVYSLSLALSLPEHCCISWCRMHLLPAGRAGENWLRFHWNGHYLISVVSMFPLFIHHVFFLNPHLFPPSILIFVCKNTFLCVLLLLPHHLSRTISTRAIIFLLAASAFLQRDKLAGGAIYTDRVCVYVSRARLHINATLIWNYTNRIIYFNYRIIKLWLPASKYCLLLAPDSTR